MLSPIGYKANGWELNRFLFTVAPLSLTGIYCDFTKIGGDISFQQLGWLREDGATCDLQAQLSYFALQESHYDFDAIN